MSEKAYLVSKALPGAGQGLGALQRTGRVSLRKPRINNEVTPAIAARRQAYRNNQEYLPAKLRRPYRPVQVNRQAWDPSRLSR